MRKREKKKLQNLFFPASRDEGCDESNLELKRPRNLGTTLLSNFELHEEMPHHRVQ